MIEELHFAMLLKAIPEEGLLEGDIGTVVMVHNEGEAYEVEFMKDGKTIAVITLDDSDVKEVSQEEYKKMKDNKSQTAAE